MVNYVLALVSQNWLNRLDRDVLVEIIVLLDLSDISRLSQVIYFCLPFPGSYKSHVKNVQRNEKP